MPRSRHDPRNIAAVAATRERLLRAACDEFQEVTFFETDTNKIARRADLSPGTFYKHFSDKVEVFAEAFERLNTEELRQIAEAVRRLRKPIAISELTEIFVETLLACRTRLSRIRQQAEILMRTESRVLETKLRVRRNNVATFHKNVAEHGLQCVSEEELYVRIHLINGLADAIATEEFQLHGISDRAARAELTKQVLSCFEVDGGKNDKGQD